MAVRAELATGLAQLIATIWGAPELFALVCFAGPRRQAAMFLVRGCFPVLCPRWLAANSNRSQNWQPKKNSVPLSARTMKLEGSIVAELERTHTSNPNSHLTRTEASMPCSWSAVAAAFQCCALAANSSRSHPKIGNKDSNLASWSWQDSREPT